MLRAMFFAIGTFAALCGLLLFRIDRVVLTPTAEDDQGLLRIVSRSTANDCREIDPPDWLPYTLASTGALTMLYALAMPRKNAG